MMAGLQVLLCSRCRASVNVDIQNKRQRTDNAVFTCRHWQSLDDDVVLEAPRIEAQEESVAVPAQQYSSNVDTTVNDEEEQRGTAQVPDAAIISRTTNLQHARCDDMPAADNNASNNDVVVASVPEGQNIDNESLNGTFDDSFFVAPDPANPSKQVPMAFCCARCKCSDERRLKYGDKLSMQGEPREGECGYHHRHCCHKIWVEEVKEDWLSPHDQAVEKVETLLSVHGGDVPPPAPNLIAIREFERMGVCQNFLRRDTTLRGLDQDVCGVSSMWGNPTYLANNLRFQQVREKRKDDLKPAVVLDMFGGIGGGIVALKRLNIAMSKVIHVEHDMIATHVVQHQHDSNYNEKLVDDGIEHVYYSKFEMVENGLDDFMKAHGPIDVIIGGPPCSDYSGVNAYARGAKGEQGQYLIRFANLINLVQNHAGQGSHPLFFFMENVRFKQESRHEDLMELEDVIGVPPTIWDAQYLSPCRRDRSYWMNFPLPSEAQELGYEDARGITPDSCLEDGWRLPEEFLRPEDLPSEDEIYLIKTNTFLASKTKIDSDAMLKLKMDEGSLVEGRFSALERERMLGFKDGYVGEPVKQLFETLYNDAYSKIDPSRDGWRERLDPRYFIFAGQQVRYETDGIPISIKMSPPPKNENYEFFNTEQYSKHLLGLGYSIPVVELLLTNLTHLFSSRQYTGYDYNYLWE